MPTSLKRRPARSSHQAESGSDCHFARTVPAAPASASSALAAKPVSAAAAVAAPLSATFPPRPARLCCKLLDVLGRRLLHLLGALARLPDHRLWFSSAGSGPLRVPEAELLRASADSRRARGNDGRAAAQPGARSRCCCSAVAEVWQPLVEGSRVKRLVLGTGPLVERHKGPGTFFASWLSSLLGTPFFSAGFSCKLERGWLWWQIQLLALPLWWDCGLSLYVRFSWRSCAEMGSCPV